MTKNSMAGLSEKLQQQLQADQEAVKHQTSVLLKQHAQGLQKLSAAALDTTKSAIQRQSVAMEQMHAETLQRLRWLMLWPLLTSVSLSLVIVLGATGWAWWKVSKADDQVEAKQLQIRQLEINFCQTPAGRTVCKAR